MLLEALVEAEGLQMEVVEEALGGITAAHLSEDSSVELVPKGLRMVVSATVEDVVLALVP